MNSEKPSPALLMTWYTLMDLNRRKQLQAEEHAKTLREQNLSEEADR